jgi:hypothetical protein
MVRSSLGSGLKGSSDEIFRPVFWSVWMHLGLNVSTAFAFTIVIMLLRFLAAILSFGAYFGIKPNLLRDFTKLREGLATESAVLQ